ncbi:hypothetical protein KM539_01535 [Xanthomonas translucens pv. poae]|uniref:hypothetical protein n=1 Tax=Xanthomonas graminis TaxID=3390026 RepID=UPI001112FA32|nr:hypothetical protein [Xanthomonas translucens]UKE62274.1 hypothetical protein KM539_01535 [Xanthomonas translucens pv. poae]
MHVGSNLEGLKVVAKKTEFQRAAGKLISAIQKEWGEELGEKNADFSEDVMNAAHDILQCKSSEKLREMLGGKNVRQHLGDVWVQRHPSVKPAIAELERVIAADLGP